MDEQRHLKSNRTIEVGWLTNALQSAHIGVGICGFDIVMRSLVTLR